MLDLSLVDTQFQQSLTGEEDVNLELYILAYEEIAKMFNVLGTVFSFVSSDVAKKIAILKRHQEAEPDNQRTLLAMIKHETTNSITTSDPQNGCRTLLRLHRALAFVSEFMNTLYVTEGDNISTPVWNAYNATLSKHHTWLIRRSVGAAMYTLPSKAYIVEQVGGEGALPSIPRLVETMRRVYGVIQSAYEKNDLLTLK